MQQSKVNNLVVNLQFLSEDAGEGSRNASLMCLLLLFFHVTISYVIIDDGMMVGGNPIQTQLTVATIAENDSFIHIINRQQEEQIRVLKEIFVGYQKQTRPYPPEGGPTVVNISVYLRSISSVDETKMEFTSDMLLSQRWNEPRFKYTTNFNTTEVSLSSNHVSKTWIPDIFFPTLRQGEIFRISSPNQFCRIYPDGNMWLSVRYAMTFACDMNFRRYPFDEQHCKVNMSAFSLTTSQMLLGWYSENNSLEIDDDFQLPKFRIKDKHIGTCVNNGLTGNFSCLSFVLVLVRETRYYVIEAFVPTTFLVVTSWLSFWIDSESCTARLSLGLVTMLSLVSLGINIKRNLPPVSYIKAVDMWIGMCICFVFASLLETAAIIVLLRRKDDRLKPILPPRFLKLDSAASSILRHQATSSVLLLPAVANQLLQLCHVSDDENGLSTNGKRGPKDPSRDTVEGTGNGKKEVKRTRLTVHELLDLVARVLFPVSFIILCILYTEYLRYKG